MSDKLYSRRKIRIRLPSFKKYSPFKILLLVALVFLSIVVTLFLKGAYPIFKGTCETAAASKGNKIITNEVNKVMKNYTYNNLINIEKNADGKITFIEADTFLINQIVSEIIGNIQKELDNTPRINVYINMGSISGISVLNNIGPKFEIELESAGNIVSEIKTEFKSVGINQTHHKIFLYINANVGILTPFATFSKNVDTEVLLTEAIIIGEVPDTYYNLDGVEELEDTYNFIE